LAIPTAPTTSRARWPAWPRPLLLALALATPSSDARAQDSCHPAYQVGESVWYSVEPQPRVTSTSDSGCSAAGRRGQVVYFPLGARVVIFCDIELSLPAEMQAELQDSQRQEAVGLPSGRTSLPALWERLLRKHSPALTCAPGFRRMSETASGAPSVWCRRQLTPSELCPRPGSAFSDGTCSSSSCPEGMVDLDLSTAGKLGGCARCPAGRIDVAESLAARGLPLRPVADHAPVSAVLCKARASDPCQGPR